jgi:hypothetical protein
LLVTNTIRLFFILELSPDLGTVWRCGLMVEVREMPLHGIPARFEPPGGKNAWTAAEAGEQQQFLDTAVRNIYGDPAGFGTHVYGHLWDYAYGDLGSTFASGERVLHEVCDREYVSIVKAIRAYPPFVVRAALAEMTTSQKQALMEVAIRGLLDLTEPSPKEFDVTDINGYPTEWTMPLLAHGLTESQKDELVRQMQRYQSFLQDQLYRRKLVDPQEVVRKINQIKQQAISNMELLGASFR